MKRKTEIISLTLSLLLVVGYIISVRDNKKAAENIDAITHTEMPVNTDKEKDSEEEDTNIVTTDVTNEDILKLVYDSLDDGNKEKIGDNWENGLVDKFTFNEDTGIVDTERYKGKEVYRIQYRTEGDSEPASITVYFDLENRELIAYVYSA